MDIISAGLSKTAPVLGSFKKINPSNIKSMEDALIATGYYNEFKFLPDEFVKIPSALPAYEQITNYLNKLKS